MTVDFINSVRSGYAKCMKQPETESNPSKNDAVERHSKLGTCEAAAGVMQQTALPKTLLL